MPKKQNWCFNVPCVFSAARSEWPAELTRNLYKQFTASQSGATFNLCQGQGRRWGTRDLNRNATYHPLIMLDRDFCRQFVYHSRRWQLLRKLLLKCDRKINHYNTCRKEMVIAENEWWWYHHECCYHKDLEIGELNWWWEKRERYKKCVWYRA